MVAHTSQYSEAEAEESQVLDQPGLQINEICIEINEYRNNEYRKCLSDFEETQMTILSQRGSGESEQHSTLQKHSTPTAPSTHPLISH